MANEGKLYGVYGGAFDPVHRAHVTMARDALRQFNLHEVLFIPSSTPPHRARPLASGAQRLAMLHLALGDEPGCAPCACELREGLCWTIDTVTFLQNLRPTDRLCLLCGLDNMLALPKWRAWQSLLQQAHFIVLPRGGVSRPQPLPDWWQARIGQAPLDAASEPRIAWLNSPPMTLSSSAIRARIANGEPVAEDLPPRVAGFIDHHQLYQSL